MLGYQLVPALEIVIEVLVVWGMAFWFASSNSYLGGGHPKEVLQTDFGIVLDAARDERGVTK